MYRIYEITTTKKVVSCYGAKNCARPTKTVHHTRPRWVNLAMQIGLLTDITLSKFRRKRTNGQIELTCRGGNRRNVTLWVVEIVFHGAVGSNVREV